MAEVALATCPRCEAPRAAGPDCPKCGVIYAKAHDPQAPRILAPPADPEVSGAVWTGDLDDARLEHRFRLFAVPLALVISHLVVATQVGRALTKIFLSMFVHELGHAVTAWLCGYGAFPSLWVTPRSSERIAWLAIALSVALAAGAVFLWKAGRRWTGSGLAALLALHLFLTLGISARAAEALIAFGGDAGCFVLGAGLMCTFYANSESNVVRGWLRWGFLVIGGFAFSTALATWWAARTDFDAIPFGEIEGVGLSDPSRLTETYGWTTHQLIYRYLAVAGVSFAVLAAFYLLGLRAQNPAKSARKTTAR